MKSYIFYTMPRAFGGYVIPISIQSSYLRDYCQKNNIPFSLPTTELCVSGSFDHLLKILQVSGVSDILMIVSLFALEGFDFDDKLPDIEVFGILENKTLKLSQIRDYLVQVNFLRSLSWSG